MKMDNELRMEMAEILDWTHFEEVMDLLPNRRHWFPPGKADSQDSRDLTWLPDYPNDLNAMHEAEKTLESLTDYVVALARIMKLPTASILLITATARQRAEAFIAVKRVRNYHLRTTTQEEDIAHSGTFMPT